MQTQPVEDIIKILPKGVITIPKKIRQFLGFSDNSLARVKAERGRLIIEPMSTLPYPIRNYTDQEITEFINKDKKETLELKIKSLL